MNIENIVHGQCFVSVDDDIICIKAVGGFNLEGIILATQDIASAIHSLDHKSFKLLADYSELEGATPEAFDKLDEFNSWLHKQNMIAKAVVINSLVTLDILGQRTPARNEHNDKNFESKVKAIEWLKEESQVTHKNK